MRCKKCGLRNIKDEFEFSEAICVIHHRCVFCGYEELFDLSCWHGYEKFDECPKCFVYKKYLTNEWPIKDEELR